MRLIFGGVRGSGPVTGSQYTVYGGDTTSVLVLGESGERIIIDAGTGLNNLVPHLGESTDPLVLLLTHYHIDHLMGLPNFSPLYQRDRSIKIAGMVPARGRPDTWQALTTIVGEPYWPVPLAETGSLLVTHNVSLRDGKWQGDINREFLTVGRLEVRVCPVAHPGGCLAWRIDEPASGASLVFATDMEWGQASLDQRNAFLGFCQTPRPVSTLIMDGHFSGTEYPSHAGWGHSTIQEVAGVGVQAGAIQIGVTHHAPENDDELLDDRAAILNDLIRELGSDAKAFFARQGQELKIVGHDNPEDETQKNARMVILMVHQLHELGYQRLRIGPGMSASGVYWRCAVTHVANIQEDNGALVLDEANDTAMYSSGSGDHFFGWEDTSEDTPADLARKFIERFPVIARLGRGDDENYAEWFQEVVRVVEAGGFPYAYSDWSDEHEDGILPTVGGTGGLPMPPDGEG
jgi:ribonuclease BN (tRNA processing enzyme)